MKNLRELFYKTSEHVGIMYDNARSILEATDNPLRFAFSALALRELFREYFAIAAPDESIESCCWWAASDGRVTRRDRLKFLIFGYVDPNIFSDSYVGRVEDVCADFVERIDALCRTLHITKDELAKAESEQREGVDCAIQTFREAVNLIAEFQEELRDRLGTILTEALDQEFVLGPVFDDLDILSTHTRPTGVWDTEVEISDIDNEFIYFKGSGSVSCDLQYGSDADQDCGDGVALESSFPFSFEGRAPVDDPTPLSPPRRGVGTTGPRSPRAAKPAIRQRRINRDGRPARGGRALEQRKAVGRTRRQSGVATTAGTGPVALRGGASTIEKVLDSRYVVVYSRRGCCFDL